MEKLQTACLSCNCRFKSDERGVKNGSSQEWGSPVSQ
jgi:hypothetical protein